MVVEPERAALRFEGCAQRSDATDQEQGVRPSRLHDRHRVQQIVEAHAGLEIPDREQERPVRRDPERAPDGAAIGGRPEPLRFRRTGDHDDALPRHGVELPELVGREMAENVNQRGTSEARALERPQHRGAGRAHQAGPVPRGHPAARPVLERRRRIEAVEAGKSTAGPRGERPVARERLVQMEDVGRLPRQLLRCRAPRPEDRALDEARDRAPIDEKRANPDTLSLEGNRRGGTGIGTAHDADVVTARREMPRLLPEHPLAPARRVRRRHVGDHEDAERVVHAPVTGASSVRAGRGTRASTARPSSASRGGRRESARRSDVRA